MEDTTTSNSNSSSAKAEETCRKIDVFFGRLTTPGAILRRLKESGTCKTGTDLHIHVDPVHGKSDAELLDIIKRVVPLTPRISKVQVGTHDLLQVLHPGARMRTARWPIKLLTSLLRMLLRRSRRHHPELTFVRVCCLKLVGSWQDFQDFSVCVRELMSVERFNLDKVSMEDVVPPSRVPSDAPRGCWLDPVMESLSTLPRLKHLRILGASDFGKMSTVTMGGDLDSVSVVQSQTLRNVCASPSLRSLCLIHFNLSDDNVAQMAQQLETNEAMAELDIDCTLGNESTRALVSLMEHNKGLEDLNLCVRGPGDGNNNNADGNSNANSAAQEQLEEVLKMEDYVNLRLAEGVRKSGLVNFALFRGRLSPKSQEAFRDTVRQQYCLESLTLYTGNEVINAALAKDPIIAFHCKMNKFGRRQLLTGKSPTKRWLESAAKAKILPTSSEVVTPEQCFVDILGRVSHDISCLFYVLSENPSICDRALQKILATEEKEKRKAQKKRSKRRSVRGNAVAAPPSKRKRLYRKAKYEGVSYT